MLQVTPIIKIKIKLLSTMGRNKLTISGIRDCSAVFFLCAGRYRITDRSIRSVRYALLSIYRGNAIIPLYRILFDHVFLQQT